MVLFVVSRRRLEPVADAVFVGLRGLDSRSGLLHERVEYLHDVGECRCIDGAVRLAVVVLSRLFLLPPTHFSRFSGGFEGPDMS